MIKLPYGDPIERCRVTETALPKPKPSIETLRKAVTAILLNRGGRPKKPGAFTPAQKQARYRAALKKARNG